MKKYNNKWDQIYVKKIHHSVWPWNEVISTVKKNYKDKNKNILELGCGFGANIPFFLSEKYKYYGLDFSKIAIERLKKKYPILKQKLILADITKHNFFNFKKKFGIVLDRGTLTHLKDKEIVELFKKLKKITNKNSLIICCSLYSEDTDRVIKKDKIQNYFSIGPFKDLGYINFFNERKLKKIFKDWLIINMEKVTKNNLLNKTHISYWNITLKRK
jgi:SAM-dependent methyltransferase